MTAEQLHDKMEAYLANGMTSEERLEFESDLETNAELQVEFELHKMAYEVITIGADRELKEKLQEIGKSNIPTIENSESRFSSKQLFLRVAAVLVILMLSVVVFDILQPSDPQELYAEYFETYRAPINTRSQQGLFSADWQQAAHHYREGEYEKAIITYELMLQEEENDHYLLHYYLGMSILNSTIHDSELAIPHLQKVFESANDYHQQASWYLALAYLESGDEEAARIQFQKVVDQENRFKLQESLEILHKLE